MLYDRCLGVGGEHDIEDHCVLYKDISFYSAQDGLPLEDFEQRTLSDLVLKDSLWLSYIKTTLQGHKDRSKENIWEAIINNTVREYCFLNQGGGRGIPRSGHIVSMLKDRTDGLEDGTKVFCLQQMELPFSQNRQDSGRFTYGYINFEVSNIHMEMPKIHESGVYGQMQQHYKYESHQLIDGA